MSSSVFTVCDSGCGKVMFSQACVKNYVHGGRCLHPGESASRRGGSASGRGGQTSPSTTGYGQKVGGTHSTGMYSCFCQSSLNFDELPVI